MGPKDGCPAAPRPSLYCHEIIRTMYDSAVQETTFTFFGPPAESFAF